MNRKFQDDFFSLCTITCINSFFFPTLLMEPLSRTLQTTPVVTHIEQGCKAWTVEERWGRRRWLHLLRKTSLTQRLGVVSIIFLRVQVLVRYSTSCSMAPTRSQKPSRPIASTSFSNPVASTGVSKIKSSLRQTRRLLAKVWMPSTSILSVRF